MKAGTAEIPELVTYEDFAGYVTITARDATELEAACGEVEQQAAQARLVLSRVYGDQELAFTLTLPICRGLP